jgi:hypothetical protein
MCNLILGHLCEHVATSLEGVILEEIGRFETRPALDLEVETHDNFARERAQVYGRTAELRAIEEYLKYDERRPLVLYGASGSGKSAIMAQASGRVATEVRRGGRERAGPGPSAARPIVIRRFIGASPESSNGLTLLRSLRQQISREYGGPEDTPTEFNPIVAAFREEAGTAAWHLKSRPRSRAFNFRRMYTLWQL